MIPPTQKNIVYGSIHANGNVHIGDNITIYNIERDFKSGSILFLRLEKTSEGGYLAHLSVKSKHSTNGQLATTGEKWCENFELNISLGLFDTLKDYQSFRRQIDTQTRYNGLGKPDNQSIQATENKLAQEIYQSFFTGAIGETCKAFIGLLEEQRLDELLLAISADDEIIVNLPFEMVLPFLFPPKLGEAKKSLAVNTFGLVRTKVSTLEAFQMQGEHASAAPLKMLFITALPENLDERGKMLQIEEEQSRLIRSIGALEATGDKQPKIVIEFLENASLAELDKALKTRQHDIVHISGHGAYHAAEKKGVLYFEDENGDEKQISGAKLGETLRQHQCVKLLILSACETAIAGNEGGVTEQVAAFGIPSVVAMRFAVTDEGAKVFTTELYTQLAKGLTLTNALAYSREALLTAVEQKRELAPQALHIAEWFTPVVYQNQAIGALIDKTLPYQLPDNFYPASSFLKTKGSRLIGEGFIGRKRYLIQMRQAFRAKRHICLHGLGGLGKTTLAEAFAHNYDNHSHSTIIFRNGNQINEAHILNTLNKRFAKINADLAEQIQQTIDDPETDILEKLQLLIDNYLKGRKTILLFDNVEDVQKSEGGEYQRHINSESLSAFLKYLCENTPADCHILFTTRYKIEDLADVVKHLALDKMGYAEQYRLLNYSDTLRTIPLQDREAVYKRLDGHPRGYEYLEALLKKDKTFNWQQVAQSEEKVFENLLLSKVYERLTEQEQAIFQIVSIFIARTPLAALVAVSDENEANLLPIIQSLQDWSLCFLEKDGQFEVHRLTREWMMLNIIPTEKVKAWTLKAGVYFEKQLTTLNDIILAKDYFEIAEAWEEFINISFNLQHYYQLIGLNSQALELNQVVLEKNIDEKSVAIALFNKGSIFNLYGQNEDALALYEQSLAISIKIGDRQGEGATLNSLATIALVKGEYNTALQHLEQALAIQQEIVDYQGEGTTLNNIGQIYDAKGDYDTALQYLEQSLIIKQQIGHSQGEGTTLNNISQIYKAKGDYDTALQYLEKSLKITQKIGDRKGEGTILNNISQIYYEKGSYDSALQYVEKSLKIAQEIGDLKNEGGALNNIGQIYKDRKDYNTALQYLEPSLAIAQQVGDRQGEGTTLNNIGQIYSAKKEYNTALHYLEQALKIEQEIGDRKNEGVTLNNISQVYKATGDYDTALQYLEKSLKITQKIGDPKNEVGILNNLATTTYKKEDNGTTLQYLEQALVIAQQVGDRQGEDTTLNNISQIYQAKGDYNTALQYLRQGLTIRLQSGDILGVAITLATMGTILFEQEHYEDAAPLLMQAYIIFEKTNSPNIQKTAVYLVTITELLGEDKFFEIISKIE